jgi:hypothetical protein
VFGGGWRDSGGGGVMEKERLESKEAKGNSEVPFLLDGARPELCLS